MKKLVGIFIFVFSFSAIELNSATPDTSPVALPCICPNCGKYYNGWYHNCNQ